MIWNEVHEVFVSGKATQKFHKNFKMPKKFSCSGEVKNVLKKHSHRKCTPSTTTPIMVTGSDLNSYLKTKRHVESELFIPEKEYQVCKGFHKMLSKQQKEQQCVEIVNNTTTTTPMTSPSLDNNVVVTPPSPPSSYDSFINDITPTGTMSVQFFKKRFGELSMKSKQQRIITISKIVLAACVDKEEAREKGKSYISKNEELACDVLNLIDSVKQWIVETKIGLRLEKYKDLPLVPVDGDLIEDVDLHKKRGYALAKQLLGHTSRSGYENVRKSIFELVDDKEGLPIPSHYSMMKDCPEMETFCVPIMKAVEEGTENEGNSLEVEMATYGGGEEEEGVLMSPDAPIVEDDSMLEERLVGKDDDDKNTVTGARIKGGYSAAVKIMEKKNKERMNRCKQHPPSNDSMIVIDSFDGAEHSKSHKSITNVISYSSILYSAHLINNKCVTSGSSRSILTWQQMGGKESVERVLAAVRDHYESKQRFIVENDNSSKYTFYDMHDGKMLYLLTQHGQWNRKYHPFLLCKCSRGDGVLNNDSHVCRIIGNAQQKEYYKKSKLQWEKQLYKIQQHNNKPGRTKKTYEVKDHMKWVDKHNYGISHFGVSPDVLDRDKIRFDTFHLKCAITRNLMNYTRTYFNTFVSVEKKQLFYSELENFWNKYHINVWSSSKSFSSFRGNELALFVANSDAITNFIESSVIDTELRRNLVGSLRTWTDVFKFLATSWIEVEEREAYKGLMSKFEADVKRLYNFGKTSFLSKRSRGSDSLAIGADETFYWHTLRFYMPEIVKETFERHKLGVGIFNMQGFERRNKESKMMVQRYCNFKGDTVKANLAKVWAIFHHNMMVEKDDDKEE